MTLDEYELYAELLFRKLMTGKITEREYERLFVKLDAWYGRQLAVELEGAGECLDYCI